MIPLKGKEIFAAALNVLAETNDSSDRSDYEERYPYILALFCGEAEELDRKYRLAHGMSADPFSVALSEIGEKELPLSEVFTSAAVYHLAAMLVFDENTELSDRLFEKFASRMADIYSALPAECGKIKNMYM